MTCRCVKTAKRAAVGAAKMLALPILPKRNVVEAEARADVSCGSLIVGGDEGQCGCVVGRIDRATIERVRAEYAHDPEAGRTEALRSMSPAGKTLLQSERCPLGRWPDDPPTQDADR